MTAYVAAASAANLFGIYGSKLRPGRRAFNGSLLYTAAMQPLGVSLASRVCPWVYAKATSIAAVGVPVTSGSR